MKELFTDLLKIEEVKGILLLSVEGEPIFHDFPPGLASRISSVDWAAFVGSMDGVREADLVFESMRVYIRKTDPGYLMVLMEPFAPSAMIRLNCDVLLPSLKKLKIPGRSGGQTKVFVF